ncbi:hypothetical protein [Caballeronia ptereochthonis]|uniref:Uncharacterized protein n=1 Tax=Caballeronia ptereochthonis TaxID=1777144 RepID=A0A158E2P0_9BURK|nr:hypothetical protein [Caballeronia ptereochthonis]SAL00706.1 hypothetical protein AWB83_06282 [Caballeronia ptereochthonis]
MAEPSDFTYITAHFIEREIDHLTRMIRSRHWHRSAAWPVSYWRGRIEALQHAPAIAPVQRVALRSLLDELERIAADLAPSPKYGDIAQVEGHAAASATIGKTRR